MDQANPTQMSIINLYYNCKVIFYKLVDDSANYHNIMYIYCLMKVAKEIKLHHNVQILIEIYASFKVVNELNQPDYIYLF